MANSNTIGYVVQSFGEVQHIGFSKGVCGGYLCEIYTRLRVPAIDGCAPMFKSRKDKSHALRFTYENAQEIAQYAKSYGVRCKVVACGLQGVVAWQQVF